MSLFKCKMCGGTLEIKNETVAVCEYCGTQQTLPKLNDERRANLYDRANHFRRSNEFDKAMGMYERILGEDTTDSEAYWSLVLCRFGVEYVEDPTNHKRIPTVNRAQYTSIFDDDNYKSALKYADGHQRHIYQEEAKAINEIQKGILAISQKEEPFDVFICYKETDRNGRRTSDSVLANDLYHQLTQEGFKVFFSRITLEDKLGVAYEPYIFAALNSAKVMVVVGTKPEYFNAVWVKNEWSRYLSLIRGGAKKVLIPAYRDMDPYDLPEEFSHLQAQDMGKLGFMQDLIRGIKKLAHTEQPKQTAAKETVITTSNSGTAPLLKRTFMFLEDGDWNSANEYCERVLDIDPECASAYLGKLMAELHVCRQEDLNNCAQPFDSMNSYQKVLRFGDEKLCAVLKGYIDQINERNEHERLEGIYRRANNTMSTANTESSYKEAARLYESIAEYNDSAALAQECYENAEIKRKDAILAFGKSKMTGEFVALYEDAIIAFKSIPGWKDADEKAYACKQKIEILKAKEEADRLEYERKAEIARKEAERIAKRNEKIFMIAAPVIAALAILALLMINVIKYNNAIELQKKGKTLEAAMAFGQITGYRDAWERSSALWNEIVVHETVSAGYKYTVGLRADGTVVATGNNEDGQCDVSNWTDIVAISAGGGYRTEHSGGGFHTVGLRSNGTVVATGWNGDGRCDVEDWSDIVAICADSVHTVGLRADGTVVAAGWNGDGVCNVEDWTNIVAISTGIYHTVGLRADGTVVATGNNEDGQCDVANWTDIVAVDASEYYTTGLCADGTVVDTGRRRQDVVEEWPEIVAISASWDTVVGLRTDGTVVATGSRGDGVEEWSNIIAIRNDLDHIVGLHADGTVVAIGRNDDGRCNVGSWTDIVSISVGSRNTVGLRADGTVVATGNNEYGQCNVDSWTNIKLPN